MGWSTGRALLANLPGLLFRRQKWQNSWTQNKKAKYLAFSPRLEKQSDTACVTITRHQTLPWNGWFFKGHHLSSGQTDPPHLLSREDTALHLNDKQWGTCWRESKSVSSAYNSGMFAAQKERVKVLITHCVCRCDSCCRGSFIDSGSGCATSRTQLTPHRHTTD